MDEKRKCQVAKHEYAMPVEVLSDKGESLMAGYMCRNCGDIAYIQPYVVVEGETLTLRRASEGYTLKR